MAVSVKFLQYFVAAADCGSIAAAARKIGISTSAIRAAIDIVEASFSTTLFFRHPAKGLILTPRGKEILDKTRILISDYENYLVECSDTSKELSGNLEIGYFAPIAPAFLPEIIGKIYERHKNVNVNIVETDNEQAQEKLLKGEFDVIFMMDYIVRSGVIIKELLELPPYLLVAETSAFAKLESVNLNDLADENLILLDNRQTRDYYLRLLGTVGALPRFICKASNVEMVRSMVSCGHGVAILNMRPHCLKTYQGHNVKYIPVTDVVKPVHLVLGYAQQTPRRLVREFLEHCGTHFFEGKGRNLLVQSVD